MNPRSQAMALSPTSDEVERWCSSGLLSLCGSAGGPPVPPPRGLVEGLDRLVRRIEVASRALGAPMSLDWPELVCGRAGLLGLARRGRISANGSCHLLEAADGWVAINLARVDDLDLLDALLESPVGGDHWADLARFAAPRPAAAVVERGRLLGLAISQLSPPTAEPATTAIPLGSRGPGRRRRRVVDLSALWAGPLCASILGRTGMDVVKVESGSRPDGARGEPAFFRWLHDPSHDEVVLDLEREDGRAALRTLLEDADVIIESSRPRALRQLGAAPGSLALRPGAVWISITAHGRVHEAAVGFGDDAAVAGGLVGLEGTGSPVFCGDAIADPIAGMAAAAEVLEAIDAGGGVLLDTALSRAAASMLDRRSWGVPMALSVGARGASWWVEHDGRQLPVSEPGRPAMVGG